MLTNTAVRKILINILTFIFVISYSYAQAANELPQTFTLDGQLMLTGSSTALSDANAGVVVQILDPSKNCLLYEEQQSVNTTLSSGYFNIQVGSVVGSTKRTASDPGLTMAQIYQNTAPITAANAPGKTCPGLSYTPTVSDSRYFRLIVTPSATGIADTLSPDTKMDSVPMSLVAQTLQGYQAGQFLMIGPGDLTQANLQSVFAAGNASKLNSLLSVPTSNYVMKGSASGLVQLSSGAGTPAGVAAGQIWYEAGLLKYYDGAAVKTLSNGSAGITDITAGSGLTGGVISTGGQTIAVDHGTTANKIVKLDGTAKLPAVDGSALTNVIATGLANGASIDITGAITTTGNITGQNISATGANFKTLTLTNASSQYLSIIPPAAITGTPVFTWPGSTGTANQVLKTDGAGVLSWSDASSVLGTASGDLSGTYPSPTVAKLRGVSVSATAPTANGQVLRYDGSAWVPNFVAMTDLRSTVTGTSQFGASCTSGQTLTYNAVGDIMSCQNISVSASNFANQNANLVLAGPTSGGAAAPSFRTLVSADTPFAVINGGQAGAITAGPSDANALTLQTGGSARLSILASGDVGIGTATPGAKLDIKGAIRLSGAASGYTGFQPAVNAGSTVWTLPAVDGASGQVLSTNGSGDLTWATASSGSVTSVDATQPLSSTGGATPTISITRSSATADGYLASTDFSIFNNKLSSTLSDGRILVGNGSNVAVAVVMSGDASLSNAGVISLTSSGVTAGSYSSVTVDAKGRVTSGSVSQDLSAVTGTLAIANGGTGQTTADAALNALLPTQTGNSGKVLQTNGSATSWVAPTSGTVTSVTAAATAGNPIVMGGTAGVSPTIDIPKATAAANGYLSSSDWTMFNDKISTATVFSGDISGTAAAISVDKIRGTNVNITAIAANNYLRYNGTDWVNANLVSTDITSSLGYTPANPTVLANYLPLAGGTMSGDLNLGGNKILNLKNVANASADPTVAEDGKTLRWNNTSGQWEWFTAAAAGAGITSLNGQNGSAQSFAVNNGGTFGFTSATNVHTLNIPSSTAAVTGLLSSADFTSFNSKLSATLANGTMLVGNGSNVATAVTMSGDASMSNAGAVTLTNSATTRGNLGLGTSAVYNVAVAGDAAVGDVVKGDDSRLTNSRAPTGAASGDLTGTYPNPTLAAVATAGTYAGAVTIDAKGRVITAAASLDLTNGVTGALPIANGGTGQISALLGFNALSPLTTKGDIITRDGTNNIRLPVGTDGLVLKANSATASGLEWASATAGSVTSVTASAPLVSSGGQTPNIILARSSAAADGYLASTDWTIFNNKLTSTLASGSVFVGNGSNVATAVIMSGDATLSNAGVISLVNTAVTAGTYGSASAVPSFTVDAKGRLTLAGSSAYQNATGASKGIVQTGANITNTAGVISLVSTDITGALGYTPATAATTIAGYGITDAVRNGGQTGAITAGPSDANALTLQTGGSARLSILASGDVGIGTAAPNEQLEITGNMRIPATSATVGVIKQGSNTLIHTFGTNNFFAGTSAGNLTTTAINTTAVGYQAGQGITSGNHNTMTGDRAGYSTTTGGWNSFYGQSAGYFNVNGDYNSFFGRNAGELNTSGSSNAFFGHMAGAKNTTGANNTFIGKNAGNSDGTVNTPATLTNASAIGYNAQVTTSNSLVLGGSGAFAVNVGIGTTAPGAPLDVKGAIRMSGATSGYAGFKPAAAAGSTVWTLPTADGTSGQVLSTNGSGDLTWIAPTTGSVTSVAASAPLASSGTSTPTISITRSSATVDGYLASTDFTIFNNKLSTTTTFSGDISGTFDSTVLANVATTGTYAGAVTIDAKGRVITAAASLDLTNGVTGALPIANGGTGQITALLGFNALSPMTTKGDLVTNDGTNDVRLGVGTNGYVLMADSAETSGLKWAPVMTGTGTTNKIPKFTAAGTIGDSAITDNGTTIVATRSIATTTNTVGAAAVNLALSNSHVLAAPGGSVITLSNMSDGGVYNIVIADTVTSRTYTFAGCANSYYKPANAPTTVSTRTVYGVMTIYNGATYDCYITWSTGFQ